MLRRCAAILCCALALPAVADDIMLIGTMGNKGVFQINGLHKTLSSGQESGAFKVIRIEGESAVVASNGQQRTLQLGQGYVASSANPTDNQGGTLVLQPDQLGHYSTELTINRVTLPGVIDTGATHLSLSRNQAAQMKISTQGALTGRSQTANGIVGAWMVRVQQLQMGKITVYDVQLVVRDVDDNGPILIGTSLLNRFQMKREQDLMILSKKAY
ncbi:TIGR02281 family clan AA aspartic protease [Chitinibacter tainanensis]|uniref:retropepsin-like aspartic protease family protein n=1 Tax=Chitinibacter tainanensis TaxID=230667 RepID=UPI002353AC78|nr:retropepsin-like aspartic protease [Chitinibacter tainanensis]